MKIVALNAKICRQVSTFLESWEVCDVALATSPTWCWMRVQRLHRSALSHLITHSLKTKWYATRNTPGDIESAWEFQIGDVDQPTLFITFWELCLQRGFCACGGENNHQTRDDLKRWWLINFFCPLLYSLPVNMNSVTVMMLCYTRIKI